MLLLGGVGCVQIVGIDEGTSRGADPIVACSTLDDCMLASVTPPPVCRAPAACEKGLCVYADAIEDTPVMDPPGDCARVVCDGAGKPKTIVDEDDPPDDGNVCTSDSCKGFQPINSKMEKASCYTGPIETKGVGICAEGTQKCKDGKPDGGCMGEITPGLETCVTPFDENCNGKANEAGGEKCVCDPGTIRDCYEGAPGTLGVSGCHGGEQSCNADGLGFGECIGQQLPQSETCDAGGSDEDCDGAINEEGGDCECGDTYVSNEEECDDGNPDSEDDCTELCKTARCGDGFLHKGFEECDDGNASDEDACVTGCKSAFCGDGFLLAGQETCDDGGTLDGDACSPTCQAQEVVRIAASEDHTCAILSGGVMKCWGQNAHGEVGIGDITPPEDLIGDNPTEVGENLLVIDLGAGQTASAISGRGVHTCVLLSGGSVKCWGPNESGQLGVGDKVQRGDDPGEVSDPAVMVNLGINKTAISVAQGNYHTCALLSDESIKCWGRNERGQLGLDSVLSKGDEANEMGNALLPVDLVGAPAKAIGAGYAHTCALLSDGGVKCWGRNDFGQLGLNDTDDRGNDQKKMSMVAPVNLGQGMTASAIAVGYYHTCALLLDGSLKCWGHNGFGQLGLGDPAPRGVSMMTSVASLTPIDLGPGRTASKIAAGGFHTCAILDDGSLKCWGRNNVGQLGQGHKTDLGDQLLEMGDKLVAIDLGPGETATAITAGGSHTCAILNDGSAKCWGSNAYGQLGRGDKTGSLINVGDEPNEMGDKLPTVKLFSEFW